MKSWQAKKDSIPPDQWDAVREMLIKQRIKPLIQTKLIYLDAKHTIPSENWPQIEKQLAKYFEEVELDKMLKRARHRLDPRTGPKAARLGTSFERAKKAYMERALAQQWVHQQIKRDEEITYDQMITYYRRHLDEFTRPARARWEELTGKLFEIS